MSATSAIASLAYPVSLEEPAVLPRSFATSSVTTGGRQHSEPALTARVATRIQTTKGDTRLRDLCRSGCLPDGRPRSLVWNYDRAEQVSDGIVHAVGLALAIFGVAALISSSWPLTGFKSASILIYAGGLLGMLGFSAAYNLWPVSPVKWRLRRFDHSAIFIFIAATYTPLIAQLKTDAATVGTLIGVWTIAFGGVLLKVFLPGRFDRLSIALCLLLGCSGFLIYESAVAALPSTTLWLIAAGGAIYTAGIIFHLCDGLRFQNSIWHAFVLAAAVCHYAAILHCGAAST
jgi:hemolysin III